MRPATNEPAKNTKESGRFFPGARAIFDRPQQLQTRICHWLHLHGRPPLCIIPLNEGVRRVTIDRSGEVAPLPPPPGALWARYSGAIAANMP